GDPALGLGDAEVDELHLTIEADEDVGGRDVAVHDAQAAPAAVRRAVGVGQRLGDLGDHVEHQVHGQQAPLLLCAVEQRAQAAPVDELKRDVVTVVDGADVYDLRYRRVLQLTRDARLIVEFL